MTLPMFLALSAVRLNGLSTFTDLNAACATPGSVALNLSSSEAERSPTKTALCGDAAGENTAMRGPYAKEIEAAKTTTIRAVLDARTYIMRDRSVRPHP